jgi:hypothetical protein
MVFADYRGGLQGDVTLQAESLSELSMVLAERKINDWLIAYDRLAVGTAIVGYVSNEYWVYKPRVYTKTS